MPNHYTHVDHGKMGYEIHSPLPHETINLLQLPDSFDWRDVGGESYVSVPRSCFMLDMLRRVTVANFMTCRCVGISTFLSTAEHAGRLEGDLPH